MVWAHYLTVSFIYFIEYMIIAEMKKTQNDADVSGKFCFVIYTQGCTFQCDYCFHKGLREINEGSVGEKEALIAIETHKDKIKWLCITGGEPTLQYNLLEFIKKVKDFGVSVKLETTGINSKSIHDLLEKKLLDYICMDIKNIWEKYEKIIGMRDQSIAEYCKSSFEAIQKSNIDHEFRTTVVPGVHTDNDLASIAGYLQKGEKYCIQNIRSCSDFFYSKHSEGPNYLHNLVDKLQVLYPQLHIYER